MHYSRFIPPTTVFPRSGDGGKWRLLVLSGAEDLLLSRGLRRRDANGLREGTLGWGMMSLKV